MNEPSEPSEPSEPPGSPGSPEPSEPGGPPDPPGPLGLPESEPIPTAAPGTDVPSGSTPTPPPAATPPVVYDPRRYRWTIVAIGLVIVAGFSAYALLTHHPDTTGVAPGHRLHWFAAPLAASSLQGDANLRPPCTPAHHDSRALNLCLDARRSPVVLSFFVLRSHACERQVDALQTLAGRYPRVRFLAVALNATHVAAARAVRAHRWTIPIAYDRDGAIGSEYAVAACPMAELAQPGGLVRARLIGRRWDTASELAPRVGALPGAQPARRGR